MANFVHETLLSYSALRRKLVGKVTASPAGSAVESSLETASDTQSGRGRLRRGCVVNWGCTFSYKYSSDRTQSDETTGSQRAHCTTELIFLNN